MNFLTYSYRIIKTNFSFVYTWLLVLWLVWQFHNKFSFVHIKLKCRKEVSTVQDGYKKHVTHAQVFSKTLAHGTERMR